MTRLRTCLIVLLVPFLISLSSCARKVDHEALSCDAALAFSNMIISGMAGHKPVFIATGVDLISFTDQFLSTETNQSAMPRPPRQLLDEMRRVGASNAVKNCPSVKSALQRGAIAFGERAVSEALHQSPDGTFANTVIGISKPVISSDGRQALVGLTAISGTLDGYGFFYLLQKMPDSRWQVIAHYPLYVS